MEWQFSNLGPGVYTFGVAPLTGMPSSFSVAPYVHVQCNNEGEPFRPAVTITGFEIVDRFTSVPPIVTVVIIER